jgi:hypothetical protein
MLPTAISTDEPVKMIGHNLNAMNEFLKPVNSETTDNTFRTTMVLVYTAFERRDVPSKYVVIPTRRPMKIRATPSVIHSIVIMRLLSIEISPKPWTTLDVGNRCAIPQPNSNKEAAYIKIDATIFEFS